MNYFLISTQELKVTKKSENATAQTITRYEDLNEAISAFHSTMASNYISDNILRAACYVSNDIGGIIKTEYIDNSPVVE